MAVKKKRVVKRKSAPRKKPSDTFEKIVRVLNSPVVASAACAIVKELTGGRRR